MRRSRAASIVALGAAAALMLAACGGGGGTSPDSGGAAAAGGSYSIYLNNPENNLIPGNTAESEGNQLLKSMFTPLINYNIETTEAEFTAVAESIESTDNINFTVQLKPGWTFHDGTPVTANSFVKAWNYTANVANAQDTQAFYEKIAGYDAENPVEELSGLAVVDDLTFTIELSAPFAQFPLTLGYLTYSPLPEAFYADPEAFGRKPIGNGPFQASADYAQDQGMTVTRYDGYMGDDKPIADSVEFRVIADINTAYNELLAGNLDVLRYVIPPELIETAKTELGDRYFEREAASFNYLGFPTYDPRFADKRVRQAFSMAIDRATITEQIFFGARAPAYDVIPPTIDGHRPDACQYCQYDPARAQQLLAESGFDTSQPVELWFNSGATHDQWVQAVGNQLQQNLGITYSLRSDFDLAQYLPFGDEQNFTGPFRLGWGMDYPSPQNFLEPLFSTSATPPAGSNTTFYSNPEFDRLVLEGNQASDNDAAIALYQQADDLLLEDMPMAPMFFSFSQGGHSENVSNVRFDAFQDIALTQVTPTNG